MWGRRSEGSTGAPGNGWSQNSTRRTRFYKSILNTDLRDRVTCGRRVLSERWRWLEYSSHLAIPPRNPAGIRHPSHPCTAPGSRSRPTRSTSPASGALRARSTSHRGFRSGGPARGHPMGDRRHHHRRRGRHFGLRQLPSEAARIDARHRPDRDVFRGDRRRHGRRLGGSDRDGTPDRGSSVRGFRAGPDGQDPRGPRRSGRKPSVRRLHRSLVPQPPHLGHRRSTGHFHRFAGLRNGA